MQLKVDERTYLTLIRVGGVVSAEDRHALHKEVDGVMRAEPLAVVWDLSELDSIADWALAVLLGNLAHLKLRGSPLVIVGATRDLIERVRSTGLGYDAAVVSDEQEACVTILETIPTRYDELFQKILVQEGYLKEPDLARVREQFEREGGVGDFGKLLLREGLVSAPRLLEAVCKQKTALGDILVESGKISAEELEQALQTQGETGEKEKLGDLLLRLGLARTEDIYEALARQFKRRKRLKAAPGKAAAPAPADGAARSARLGEILLEQKLLSQEDLDRSLQLQRQTQGREKLGDILVRLGFVSDSDLYTALLTQYERVRPGDVSGDVKAGMEALITKLGSHDYLLSRQAAEGLLSLGAPAFSILIASLRNPRPAVRRGAADVLGDAMCFEAVPALMDRLEDAVTKVRFEACWALTRITGQGFGPDQATDWQVWWRETDLSKLPGAAPTISSHREDMARFLAKAVDEGHDLSPFDLEYRTGQEEWEGGHVRMQLRGDGLVNVLHLTRGETRAYIGDLGDTEARQHFAGLAAAGILFVDTGRTADDGQETRHEVSLRIGNRYFRRSTLYYRELFQHWNFRSFESRLRDVLRRLTRGAIM